MLLISINFGGDFMDKLKTAGMMASGQTSSINSNGSEEKTAWSELVKKYPGKWVIYIYIY